MKLILQVLSIFFLNLAFSPVNTETIYYKCIYETEDWCTFYNITISRPRFQFKLTADNPKNVTKVRFTDSIIHTWTNHTCDAFPNLTSLEVDQVYLRNIAFGALDSCENLKIISFWTNQLTRFDKNNFRYNFNLREINVQSNKIYYFHPETFNHLLKLEVLSLNENLLKVFPLEKMNRLEHLRTLYIDTNCLEDLDDDLIVEKFPALKTIYMDDNNFECDRLQDILRTFANKNISAKVWSAQHKKTRKIKPQLIQNIECYDDGKLKQLMGEIDYQVHHMAYLFSLTFELIHELQRKNQSTYSAVDQKIIGSFQQKMEDMKRKLVVLSESNNRFDAKFSILAALFFLSTGFVAFGTVFIGYNIFKRKKITGSHSMLILNNDINTN